MHTHDYVYKNRVFEGGGVKGVAYGGVFEVTSKTIEQPCLPLTGERLDDPELADFWQTAT